MSEISSLLSPAENRVLSELREAREPLTKLMIKNRTQLSLTAVNLSVEKLIGASKALVDVEFKKERNDKGRPKQGGATGFYNIRPNAEFYVGLELGSSKLRVCILGSDLQIKKPLVSYPNTEGFQSACENAGSLILQSTKGIPVRDIAGIGIAYPGSIVNDTTQSAVNIGSEFLHRNLAETIRGVLGKRRSSLAEKTIVASHNSSCTVLAERERGGANFSRRNERNLLSVQLGMGIGLGLSLDGLIYQGTDGRAGEMGHMIVEENGPPCSCGKRGCLEALASATAVTRRAMRSIESAKSRAIVEAVSAELEGRKRHSAQDNIAQIQNSLEGRHIVAAAVHDPYARELLNSIGKPLGRAVSYIINLLAPERVVIGGRFSNAYQFFGEEFLRTCKANTWEPSWKEDLIVMSNLPEEGTCIGAAIHLFESIYGSILFGPVSKK